MTNTTVMILATLMILVALAECCAIFGAILVIRMMWNAWQDEE